MTDDTTPATNETPDDLKDGRATYCPEDNKLRLYVGRVPRPEYEALRADGWTSTPKQDCDFVAVWTPSRRATCLQYADIIEDEDKGPDERAADRAERFGEYLDKRTAEATGHADRYDAGPGAHGFQSVARAERAALRHDRVASYACDAWSKAEYWQRRTAGVISHALYLCAPGVRMGRIKTLEADLRRAMKGGEWEAHLTLRLAYENQMLEAQGGRAAHVEMEAGGWLGAHQIQKVNKSSVTGRVVSVAILMPTHGRNRWGNAYPDPATAPTHRLEQIETERMAASVYRAPTDEERAAFLAEKKAKKAAAPKVETIPLVNPSPAEAEKLQAALNARALADHCARHLRAYGSDYAGEFKPSTVCTITQAQYSAASGGTYSRAETRGLCKDAELEPQSSSLYSAHAKAEEARRGPSLCKIRITQGNGSDYGARRVIVLTDKPHKPLPRAVWQSAQEPVTPSQEPAQPAKAAPVATTSQPDLFNLDAAIERARELATA